MGIRLVTELPVDGSAARKAGQSTSRGMVRRHHVEFDEATSANAVLARMAPGVPRIGSPHPEDVYAWCTDVDARPDGETRLLYVVESTYSSSGSDESGVNPIDRRPVVNWDWELSTEPIDHDANGSALLTVNNEPYDPPLMGEFADLKVSIERNYADFDPYVLQTYRYVVNSDSFLGFPAGTALMKPIRAQSQIEGTFSYWSIFVEIVFRVDPEGVFARSWYRRVRQQGFLVRPLPGAQPVRAKVLDSDGVTLIDSPSPVPLRLNGTAAAAPEEVGWLYHPRYPTLPFGGLNLL